MKPLALFLVSLNLMVFPLRLVWSSSGSAIEFDNGSGGRYLGGGFGGPSQTTGWEFTPLTDIVIDRIGLFDGHATGGFTQPHVIGLWSTDGALITSVAIPAGEQLPLTGSFRYVDVPEIRLPASIGCVIAAFSEGPTSDGVAAFSSAEVSFNHVRFDPNIRFEAYRSGLSQSLQFPADRGTSGFLGNFGPGFTLALGSSGATDTAVEMRLLNDGSVFVGEPVTIAVTLTNRGILAASNAWVRVTNSIPGGFPPEAVTSTQGTCQTSGGSVFCDLGNLAPNSSASVTFGFTAPPFGYVVFEATSGSDTPDPLSANNSATNQIPIYAPRLQFLEDGFSFEGEPVELNLHLIHPLTRPFTVEFATSNGTAVAGQDYVGTNGTITFGPGETRKTITVSTLDEQTHELDESFSLLVWAAGQPPIVGRGVIVDEDWPEGPYWEGFESGGLSPSHWTSSGAFTNPAFLATNVGAFVTSEGLPHAGRYELKLAPDPFWPPVSAKLRLNVANYTNLVLCYWARDGGGPAGSLGFQEAGVALSTDGVNSMPAQVLAQAGSVSPLTSIYGRFEVQLDPILAQHPLSGSGILDIIFFNVSRYYPGFLGNPPTLYANTLFIDDVEVAGCPKDGVVKLAQLQICAGRVRFVFPTCVGRSYQVLCKDQISQSEWRVVESVLGDGFLRVIDEPVGSEGQRFYSVRMSASGVGPEQLVVPDGTGLVCPPRFSP